jgi:hypothetical protein
MEDYIDYLSDIAEAIKINKITLLTGRNAGGKSLIRKQLPFYIGEQLGKDYKKVRIPHASQELRTKSNPSMGALSGMAHDLEWLATSASTLHTLEQVFKYDNPDFLVIDEPEIGIGEELQLGIADFLNIKTAELKAQGKGCLIICHSRIIAKNINHDKFINLEKMGYEEWLNRVPVKISVEDFEEYASTFFKAVGNRQKENKKNS